MATDRIFFSPSAGGFYHLSIAGAAGIPADAVRVAQLRYAQLMEAQAKGHRIIVRDGKPVSAAPPKPSLTDLRASAVAAVKAQASARILAIASLVRQANDTALIADHALAVAGGATGAAPADVRAAQLRRARINAVRTASNALEEIVGRMPASNLLNFDASAERFWPPAE